MNLFLIALAAVGGGIFSASLGWLESHNPFDFRKYGASCMRALVAGILFAIGYHFSNGITMMDFFAAFLGGAGIDVVGNRLAGSLRRTR
jgi:hypothetical protein